MNMCYRAGSLGRTAANVVERARLSAVKCAPHSWRQWLKRRPTDLGLLRPGLAQRGAADVGCLRFRLGRQLDSIADLVVRCEAASFDGVADPADPCQLHDGSPQRESGRCSVDERAGAGLPTIGGSYE
jgi:hypothetical protein